MARVLCALVSSLHRSASALAWCTLLPVRRPLYMLLRSVVLFFPHLLVGHPLSGCLVPPTLGNHGWGLRPPSHSPVGGPGLPLLMGAHPQVGLQGSGTARSASWSAGMPPGHCHFNVCILGVWWCSVALVSFPRLPVMLGAAPGLVEGHWLSSL